MSERWRIELFGGLRALQGERVITRFRTRKTAALLAYLACYLRQSHAREVLIELFWPGCDPEAGRVSLRTALASLRRQLEPPGVLAGSVLITDRVSVRLSPDAVTTDVAEFEAAVKATTTSDRGAEQTQLLSDAVHYSGSRLLPGYYEDWIQIEQRRLEELFFQTLCQLAHHLQQAGDLKRAIQYVQRGLSLDPLREEAHQELMRLYAAQGQPAVALRQYRELEGILKERLDSAPSAATRALALQIKCAATETPADSVPTSYLPLQLTRFFGREKEITRLSEMLLTDKMRLLTLVGAGGSGKTRLSIEVARRLSERWHGAVWFVALADLSDPILIATAVRDAMHLTPSPMVEPLEQVTAVLARPGGTRPALLVLDNFEHLLENGAALVWTLLQRVPELTILITSRQRLNLPGERAFEVRPLPIPGATGTLEQWAQNAGIQLFVDRAQAVRADFQLAGANASTVAELCHRLEGIPLAIELAAARVQVLTPTQMLDQLGQRLDCWRDPQSSRAPRHQTLRAAIAWSYRLLAPELQQFFARLSVFRGGWTTEAVQIVCEEQSTHAHGWTFDYLAHLRGCSLIVTDESADEMRCRMLETLREFAAEQLTAAEQTALARRHAEYHLKLAKELKRKLTGATRLKSYESRNALEQDNLRAAILWSLENDPELAVELMNSSMLWNVSFEARRWVERSLEMLGRNGSISLAARAQALNMAARLTIEQGDYTMARSYADEALTLWRELEGQPEVCVGDRIVRLPDALVYRGSIAMHQGDFARARSCVEELLAMEQERWGPHGVGAGQPATYVKARFSAALGLKGEIAMHQGDFESASLILEQALALARQYAAPQALSNQLIRLANARRFQGDYERAAALLEESQELKRELPFHKELLYHSQGWLARQQHDYERAATLFREGLLEARRHGLKRSILDCLRGLAGIAIVQGQPEPGVQLLGTLEAQFEAMGAVIYPADRINHDRDVAAARAALGEKEFAAAWATGRSLDWEQAIACALEISKRIQIKD